MTTTLNKPRPVVALCHWEDFNYSRMLPHEDPTAPVWLKRNEPPTACRASLGEKRLTVWLPQGARIVCRLGMMQRDNPMAQTYWEHFGGHERTNTRRIRITLTELPTP